MWTRTFWKRALERAVKTLAQTAVAGLTADATGVLDANWVGVASVSGMAAVVSVLMSIASSPVGPDDADPSLVN